MEFLLYVLKRKTVGLLREKSKANAQRQRDMWVRGQSLLNF